MFIFIFFLDFLVIQNGQAISSSVLDRLMIEKLFNSFLDEEIKWFESHSRINFPEWHDVPQPWKKIFWSVNFMRLFFFWGKHLIFLNFSKRYIPHALKKQIWALNSC